MKNNESLYSDEESVDRTNIVLKAKREKN